MNFPVDLPPDFLKIASRLRIRQEDIDEQFTKGGGPGGQKINKTNSCVELEHRPTGIVVRMQKHREQSKNRLSAYKLLILKIEEKKMGEQSKLQQKLFKIRKQKQRRSRRAKEKMLEKKHFRSATKERRQKIIRSE